MMKSGMLMKHPDIPLLCTLNPKNEFPEYNDGVNTVRFGLAEAIPLDAIKTINYTEAL